MDAGSLTSADDLARLGRWQARKVLVAVAALSVLAGALILIAPPGWMALFLCVAIAAAAVTWKRPALTVAMILGLTLLIEQYDPGLGSITVGIPFYKSIVGGGPNPLELALAGTSLVLVTQLVVRVRQGKTNPLGVLVVLLGVTLTLWFVRGVVLGGDFSIALWEVRGLFYFTTAALLAPQVIEGEKDVRLLLWVAIAAVAVKAAQAVYNYVFLLGLDLSRVREVSGHEDAVFMAWMAILLTGFALYRTGGRQKAFLLAALPIIAVAFVATDRRASYVALGAGLLILATLVWTDEARRPVLLRVCVPVLISVAMLLAISWNLEGPLGMPAAVVESVIAPSDAEDVASGWTRDVQEMNLWIAIKANPTMGLGFGRRYEDPGQNGMYDVSSHLGDYIPHNEIMWAWAKTGTVGFTLFWLVFGGIIAYGCHAFRVLHKPYYKVLAAFIAAAVATQMIVSYVDLQLTYARNMIFLGVLVGVLARLVSLDAEKSSATLLRIRDGDR